MGNLRLSLRKTRGGLEMFLLRENEKNLRYLLTVPKTKERARNGKTFSDRPNATQSQWFRPQIGPK